jgi:hypothetical protein
MTFALIFTLLFGSFAGFGAYLQAESAGFRGVIWSGLAAVSALVIALIGASDMPATEVFHLNRNPMTVFFAAVVPLVLVFAGTVVGVVFRSRVSAPKLGLWAGLAASVIVFVVAIWRAR